VVSACDKDIVLSELLQFIWSNYC